MIDNNEDIVPHISTGPRDDRMLPLVCEYVSSGKTVVLPLRGYSMRPYLEDNRAKALLAPVPDTLRIGDVILAHLRNTSGYALHRITHIDGDTIVMCGDGNLTPEVIQRSDVKAIAIGFYRNGSTKLDSVESKRYILYWKTWLLLRPIRRYLLFIWRKMIIKK